MYLVNKLPRRRVDKQCGELWAHFKQENCIAVSTAIGWESIPLYVHLWGAGLFPKS